MEKEINGKIYELVDDSLKNCDNCVFLKGFTRCDYPNKEDRMDECFANNYAKIWKLKE